jgi:membrane protease YdiL (CAAX protease family)
MNALARVSLVVLLTLAVIVTMSVDPLLRRYLASWIGNPLVVDLAGWGVRFAVWLIPLLLWPRFWDVGSLRLPRTWTIFLVLPYLLPNLLSFHGFPQNFSWLQNLWVGMAIGAWEELVFRGYALTRCATHPRLAIFLSSLAFAFMHLGDPVGNIISAFLVGMGFGIVRVVSGSLAWCMLIHGLTDFPAVAANPSDTVIISVGVPCAIGTLIVFWRHPKLRIATVKTNLGLQDVCP